jgi:hypothetical protein
LVSFFPTPLIPVLLVSRGVTAQAPSSNKRNPRTQSQEKSVAFNIKQQRAIFLELNYKEGKKNVVYVNNGHVIAVVSI